jgi:hypothetical protein
MAKQLFEMTQADLDGIVSKITAARQAPLIMLQCGPPPSIQQVANDAWAELGNRMGFKHMTVRPARERGDRFFTAEPTTPSTGEPTPADGPLEAANGDSGLTNSSSKSTS